MWGDADADLACSHAEADWPEGLALGHRDVGLSQRGWGSAQALGERFRSYELQAVVASDLRRALDTARCIAILHELTVEPWPEPREIDFGHWEGRRPADLWLEDPDAARRWETDPRARPPGFGETFLTFETRIRRAVDRLHRRKAESIVLVTHGGSLRVLAALLTDLPLERLWRDPLPPATVRAIRLTAGLARGRLA